MIQVKSFIFNAFQENTYVLYDESGECLIIDPGCNDNNEETTLISFIEAENLTPKYLVNTHCHIDHIFGNRFVADKYQVPWQLLANINQVKDPMALLPGTELKVVGGGGHIVHLERPRARWRRAVISFLSGSPQR